jgi:thioester reductase-like protein
MTSDLLSNNSLTPLETGGNECIIITGATGFLGRQILALLLERYPEARFVLPVRDKGSSSPEQRIESIVKQICSAKSRARAVARIEVIHADLSLDRCGLSDYDYDKVVAQTTRIIHSAATVRFDHPLDEARHINVGGTVSMLALASEAYKRGVMRSFTHIGTAFVAGDRNGTAYEDELEKGQSFRNTYEQTKCEAERFVRDRMNELPIIITRPSIIVGDSRTGITTSFKTLYWPLKVYAKGWWRTVPGYPDAVIDIVPVDFVSEAIAYLAFEPKALGKCAHVCAGPRGNATIEAISDYASRIFNRPRPRFVEPAIFLALILPLLNLLLLGNRRHVLKEGHVYTPYFRMKTIFDTSNAEALLSPAGIEAPNVMAYIEKLFQYCIETDWGNKHLQGRSTK